MAAKYCSNCGEPIIREDAAICYNCGNQLREVIASQKNSPQLIPRNGNSYEGERHETEQDRNDNNYNRNETPRVQHIAVNPKSPFIAFILSFFWVGLGQLYNGKFTKGLLLQIGFVIGLIFIFIPGIVVWVICLWDAYTDAEKMNRGEIPVTNPSFAEIMIFIFFWLIILIGTILIGSALMIPLAFI